MGAGQEKRQEFRNFRRSGPETFRLQPARRAPHGPAARVIVRNQDCNAFEPTSFPFQALFKLCLDCFYRLSGRWCWPRLLVNNGGCARGVFSCRSWASTSPLFGSAPLLRPPD